MRTERFFERSSNPSIMILVDKNITDIVAGYDRLIEAERFLNRRWREALLSAYSHRRLAYEAELSEYRRRSAEFNRRFRIGIWLSSALLILGAVALPALILLGELGSLRGPLLCFAPLLILGGLNGWAVLAMLWMWQKERKQPNLPEHPFENKITEELLQQWRGSLQGNLPVPDGGPDSTGLTRLIARLQPLDDSSFLMPAFSWDQTEGFDLLLVGQKGVWAFDTKNLNGVIRWQDGAWTRSRGLHSLQKSDQVEIAAPSQAFETVWQRKADQLVSVLADTPLEELSLEPRLRRVRGGLVFTHPQARFVIPPGVPFNWGVIKFWCDRLAGVPAIPEFDERTRLQVLEILLREHQQANPPGSPRSMYEQAGILIKQSEERIKAWIAES